MTPDSSSHGPESSRRTFLGAVAAGSAFGLAGCVGVGDDGNPDGVSDEFVIAATVLDSPDDIETDWEPVAEWLEDETGVPTRVNRMQSDSAAISALATGQAHAAYLSGGPSWVGWQQQGLEPIVVEVDEDGRASYTASAWVQADSGIETVEDLEGRDSCHTGDLKGAGMLIPTAHLAREGLVSFDDQDDVTAVRDAVEEFFDEPLVGGGYVGALQCLSRGQGDVAFVRDTTPEDYCGGPDAEDWCKDLEEYELLEEFARVPSHPVMVGPDVTEEERDLLREALLELNEDPEGQEILEEVFGIAAFEPSTGEEHLGPYGELIEILPGIEDHLLD